MTVCHTGVGRKPVIEISLDSIYRLNNITPGQKVMPKVSVIIPTYNRRMALLRAIQSVLDQTFKDYEIIVVNDHSTDDTEHYLSTLQVKDLHQIHLDRNNGGGFARNQGIDRSSGDYIAFLDDDDAWEPTKLEEQMTLLSSTGAGLCHTGFNLFSENGKFIRYVYIRPEFNDRFKAIMHDNFLGGTSSIIAQSALVKAAGGFDPTLPALQDYDFFIRLLKKNPAVASIEKPLVRYYFIDRDKKVSFNYKNHMIAVRRIREKYREEPDFHLLEKALRRITFKKALKSREFLKEGIRSFFK
jgi:glycosyltransferase involved in cell wall biosynthesis